MRRTLTTGVLLVVASAAVPAWTWIRDMWTGPVVLP